MAKEKIVTEITGGFTKAQYLQSKQWEGIDKDILSVVLEDGKTYTIVEAKRLLEQFKNSEVK